MTGELAWREWTRAWRVIALLALSVLAPAAALAQGYSVDLAGHEYTLGAGGQLTETLRIASLTDQPLTLTLSINDIVRDAANTGGYAYDPTLEKEQRSLAKWLTVGQMEVTLAPKEVKLVPYTITLPAGASLSGSYWCAILVTKAESPEEILKKLTPQEGKMQIGIRTVLQYAVRVIVTIPGTAHPQGKWTKAEIQRKENDGPQGAKLYTMGAVATFENSDQAFVRPQAWLEIRDTAGKSVYRSPVRRRTVLPESALDFDFDLSDVLLDPGDYIVLIIGDYGLPKLVGAQLKLSYTADDRAHAEEIAKLRAEQKAEMEKRRAEGEKGAAAPAGE